MCKKCSHGFLLMEALFALALLWTAAAVFLPMLMQMELERNNLALEEQAQRLLAIALYEEPLVGETKASIGRTVFRLRAYEEGGRMWKVCVRWNDYAGREKERCGYSKR
ncbi:competence protein ComG [Geobacillus sp. FSL K6-0789]|uniref:Competence protein ComG n=1 Tax=Geobacillus stearothermophilus TaxID=1422 RepID=A0A3L7DEF2_GEOSE|nr:competence protein ComG [Geobacillus stearothermophilus]RLQ01733.1 competence protein ComG [Geobacillus stearothermophilus]RLQ08490.1 competence protein ComG [Geobacillus stearothermophilus]RLQ10523.1 competence protein ComG [Geobacillus stearothermophilus]RLQ14111.1 competence protein ComG [Geobacillus stearothermophilus]